MKEGEEIEKQCLEKRIVWRFLIEEYRRIGEFLISRIKDVISMFILELLILEK